jgi:protein ImuA
MAAVNADIISRLQKDILRLQGFRLRTGSSIDIGLTAITNAFPNKIFPLGAVHEFICGSAEDTAATNGFIACVMSELMKKTGTTVWISSARSVFPPALKSFGISPDSIIFIDVKREKDKHWVMEEALKCKGLAAVVGELQDLDFTVSRRFQLAVEQSDVTGFVIRQSPRQLNTTACVTRWKITQLPGVPIEDLPGLGYPNWNIELLKVRNGKPGSWQIECVDGKLNLVYQQASLILETEHKKTG